MATISDFIPTMGYKLPFRQLLPSQSRSNEPLTAPQIRTLWLNALALFRPFELKTEDSIKAHKHLLKHLIGDRTLSSPEQNTTLTDSDLRVTIADLLSKAHAPCVLFLYLNCGLIRAWLGEYGNAALYFHTAIHMDDRISPANTATLYYLLGCVYFMLEEWKHSRKSFERCLLCFRKGWGTKPAELELGMAAPWVSTLNRHENEARSTGKSERTLESEFRYRVFVPYPEEEKRTTPKSENTKDKEWHEWTLERTCVETNLTAAKTKSGHRGSQDATAEDEQIEVIGFPGGVLFWPVEISTSTAADASDVRSSSQAPLSTEQPTHCPLPIPLLFDHKPPAWNEETQSFEPYLPPTVTTRFPPPLPSSRPPAPPRRISPPRQSSWAHIESELPYPPYTYGGSRHFDPDIITPSDNDYSPPLTQESSFLPYYTSPHSAASAPGRQTSGKPSRKEPKRRRAEQAARGRFSPREEALAMLEGRRESEGEGKNSSQRLRGLVRRSMASLRRGSRPEKRVEERARRRGKRDVVQERSRAEVRDILGLDNGCVAEGLSVESAIEDDDEKTEVQSAREGSRAKARKMLGLGYEIATERSSPRTPVVKDGIRVKELVEEIEAAEQGLGPRAQKVGVSRTKLRKILGLDDDFPAGALSARRIAEDDDREIGELLEEVDMRAREMEVSRAKARKVLGLSYGFATPELSPRSTIDDAEWEEEEEEEMGEWADEEEGVEDWEEPREEEGEISKIETGDLLTGLGHGGTLLPLAYKS